MKLIIRLTIDTNVPGRVALDPIYRYAGVPSRTFDHSKFTCRPEQAKVFRGYATAHLWLKRNSIVPGSHFFPPMAFREGTSQVGLFTKWEILSVNI